MATSSLLPDWYTDAGKASGVYQTDEKGNLVFPEDNHGFAFSGAALPPIKQAAPRPTYPKAIATKTQSESGGLAVPSHLESRSSVPMPEAPMPSMAPLPTMAPTPSMPLSEPSPNVGATQQSAMMAGLQAAAPDNTPIASLKQRTGNGALNPQLGQRNIPDGISGLKVLTY